jgi:hypothetical protein
MQLRLPIPWSGAHCTGLVVTAIVAFGADTEVYYAVTLAVFAGVLATFVVSVNAAQKDLEERWSPKEGAYRRRWERFK